MPAVDNMKISIFPFSHMITAMETLAVVIIIFDALAPIEEP